MGAVASQEDTLQLPPLSMVTLQLSERLGEAIHVGVKVQEGAQEGT